MALTVTPLEGDRAAFDVSNHPTKHASDLEAGTPIHHVPAGNDVGDVPQWDGDKYVPAAVSGTSNDVGLYENVPAYCDSYGFIWRGTFTNLTSAPSTIVDATLGPLFRGTAANTLGGKSGRREAWGIFKRGDGNFSSGLKLKMRVGVGNTTDASYFFGFTNNDNVADSDTPTGDLMGFWFRPSPSSLGHTNWQFMTRDGTTLHAQDTGMLVVANELYEIEFSVVPGGTTANWSVTRISTATTLTGSKGDNLPTASTFLRSIYIVYNQTAGATRTLLNSYFWASAYAANP